MQTTDRIELAVSHPARRVAFGPTRLLLERVARGEHARIDALSVVFTDHATVRDLNRRHLGRTYNTDVIAFDLRERPGEGAVNGEIYVDLDTAAERAPEFGARYSEEVRRYAVHGLLHLIGYRDDSAQRKTEMKHLEDRYLDEFSEG